MASFRPFETALRDYLVSRTKNQNDLAASIRKYGNIRFSINPRKYNRPHFIIRMGISEAAFDIDTGLILSGGLGPESNEVKNWVSKYLKKTEMKTIWQGENKKYEQELEREERIQEANQKRKNNL